MKTLSFIITLFLFAYQAVVGQIEISTVPDITPEDMVENLVGEGIIYDNVQFQGAGISSGIFTNGQTTNLGLVSGIFLTSGDGNLIPGPNNDTSAGINLGLPGHPSLEAITTASTHDAAVLSFDFIPESDTLRFKYVFGSEEYNERVFSGFDDVFGFFVSGPNPAGGTYNDKNIAIVPGTTNTSVTINNINNGYSPGGVIPSGPCTNCEYYADNTNGSTLEYDGNTTVLTAWLLVVPCEAYSIKIGVADAGDYNYDSGVFIKENSFECPQIEVETDPYPQGVSDNMIEGCVEADIIFTLPSAEYAPITVYFDLSEGTAYPAAFPPGDFEEAIPDSVVFEDGIDSVAIHINPVYDGLIEGEETLRLIIENTLGCIVRWDTVDFIITDYTLLYNTITPNTIICEDMEIDLWVHVENGIPPYSYLWEPGGFTNDSITVSPDSTTTYFVNYTDMCQESGMDSANVLVFPVCDFETFYFESALNPGLPYDIYGEVSNDTVLIVFPSGTNLTGLISSFTTDLEVCIISIDGVIQESGVTVNDFTEPLVYFFWGPGGCCSEWIVISEVETGITKTGFNQLNVYPNPANDLLTMNFDRPYELSIINSLGQTVFNEHVKTPERTIDISEFNEGLYFLQVRNDQGFIVRKLVISQ